VVLFPCLAYLVYPSSPLDGRMLSEAIEELKEAENQDLSKKTRNIF
jgi:hypothetical protein